MNVQKRLLTGYTFRAVMIMYGDRALIGVRARRAMRISIERMEADVLQQQQQRRPGL
jgi:hypothetical protein